MQAMQAGDAGGATGPVHTWFVPQEVPAGRAVAVSTQTDVPVVQDVVPRTHQFGFVSQARPAVQALHTPALQTAGTAGVASSTQAVPFAIGAVASTQTRWPVVQLVTPCTHSFALSVHASPAVHGLQTPLKQTSSTAGFSSQSSPVRTAVVVSSQVWPPVAQELTPATHSFALVEQASPAQHSTHAPLPLHTSGTAAFTSQVVPAAIGAAVSTQVSKPVAQDVVPATHGLGFVAQALPA